MAALNITGLPEDTRIVQGFFVWSGINSEGRRCSGGVEFPFDEKGLENHDYDGIKIVGLLTLAREKLLAEELQGGEAED